MAPPKKYPKSVRKKSALHSIARCYSDVNVAMPKEYWDESCRLTWESQV